MFNRWKYWRDQAVALQQALDDIGARLLRIEKLHRERNHLINIERVDRTTVFTFIRDGKIIKIEAMGMWSDDVDGWRTALIGELNNG